MISKAAPLSIFPRLAWHDCSVPVLAGAWWELRWFACWDRVHAYISEQAISTNCSPMCAWILLAERYWHYLFPLTSTQIGKTALRVQSRGSKLAELQVLTPICSENYSCKCTSQQNSFVHRRDCQNRFHPQLQAFRCPDWQISVVCWGNPGKTGLSLLNWRHLSWGQHRIRIKLRNPVCLSRKSNHESRV